MRFIWVVLWENRGARNYGWVWCLLYSLCDRFLLFLLSVRLEGLLGKKVMVFLIRPRLLPANLRIQLPFLIPHWQAEGQGLGKSSYI